MCTINSEAKYVVSWPRTIRTAPAPVERPQSGAGVLLKPGTGAAYGRIVFIATIHAECVRTELRTSLDHYESASVAAGGYDCG